jgi:hypothetical protein
LGKLNNQPSKNNKKKKRDGKTGPKNHPNPQTKQKQKQKKANPKIRSTIQPVSRSNPTPQRTKKTTTNKQ